jgi:Mg-chelatase subunit ChlD
MTLHRDTEGNSDMRTRLLNLGRLALFGAMMGTVTPVAAQDASSASILIYDASGSMWGQLDGGATKVEVAREVIGDFFASRDNAVPLGVVAYGHNRRGDCSDIEVVATVGINDPAGLSASLNRLNPRGMTPITESLSRAAAMIPPTAESADIILVTDGLETCAADPCALAAQLASEGIAIRAHVVGFGLTTQEAEAMSCVADATGGLLLTPRTGQELAEALRQVAQVQPVPAPEPEPEPDPVVEAFFDIGPKAEAGFTYSISYQGTAQNSDFAGFTRRGEGKPPSSGSFGPIGGGSPASNPFTKRAPVEPGEYDIILFKNNGDGIIARQPIEVVGASSGFDPVGSVEPGSRLQVAFRGPEQTGERLVLARPDQPASDFRSYGWDFALHKNGIFRVTAPDEPGIYELRYLNSAANEVMFSRQFGVGVPFEDADQTNTAQLAAQAAALTQAAPGQDDLPMVPATFRLPPGYPEAPHEWSAVPLDPDMSPEAWAPSGKTLVGEGVFEPGRYEVTAAQGPGAVFKGVVEILPGQANDFVIPAQSEEDAHAPTLDGPWQILGVPPYQVQAGADQLLTLSLEQAYPDAPVSGTWTAKEMLAGPQAAGREGDFSRATLEDEVLRLTFTVGEPIPEPMSLYLTPYGIGYAGSLSSGTLGISVVMWPGGYEPPSLAEMREAVHGAAPADHVDISAPAPPASQAKEPAAASEVPVRLRTPFEVGDVGVQWSAIRIDVQEMDVAFASSDFETSFVTTLTAGGTYEIAGVNQDAGIHLADTITVDPNGRNDFEIPLSTGKAGDAGSVTAASGEDVAFVCSNTPAGCPITHAASGISLTLPNDWSMSEPYFYETAGGVRSDVPSASFFWEGPGGISTIELNPRQWLGANGRCEPVGGGELCYHKEQDNSVDITFEMIRDTIIVSP